MKRIGLLIYGSLITLSGGFLYDRMLVNYLRRQGNIVKVLSLPWRDYTRHLGDNLSQRLFHRLLDLNVDLLVQDELNHPSLAWTNRRVSDRVGYPIVAIVHHLRCKEPRTGLMNWFYRVVESRYLNSVDAFIFNSRTTQSTVQALLGSAKPGVVAVPGGDRLSPVINVHEIATRSHSPGPLRILFLGNVIPRKGLSVLLSALEYLPSYAYQLTVVGDLKVDRSYSRAICRQVTQAGMSDRVTFSGSLQAEELVKCLRNQHMLALPSFLEGYGIAYIEAMGFALPAIATTEGAAHEIITHGKDGYLIPPGDHRSLAEVIRKLHDDRDQLLAMSQSAISRYNKHPTWEQSMSRIDVFLTSLLN